MSPRTPMLAAILIDTGATVIDFAGPWEAFQDAQVDGQPAFALYTVGPSRDPIRTSGYGLHHVGDEPPEVGWGGFFITPEFTFDDAPQPDIVVMGAQGNHAIEKLDWIRRVAPGAEVVLSVCTGAFLLARTGLLDGLSATTHHEFFDRFAETFPKVALLRGSRFVDNGRFVTAGGLTSGVDGALHVIERYLGSDVAIATAAEMEYQPVVELGQPAARIK
jgi:transcriptional regulator GlxA family with amidase domain